jgi:hypothetical protein
VVPVCELASCELEVEDVELEGLELCGIAVLSCVEGEVVEVPLAALCGAAPAG